MPRLPAGASRRELHEALREHDDERAGECASALGEEPPDLHRLELVLEGQRVEGSPGRLILRPSLAPHPWRSIGAAR